MVVAPITISRPLDGLLSTRNAGGGEVDLAPTGVP